MLHGNAKGNFVALEIAALQINNKARKRMHSSWLSENASSKKMVFLLCRIIRLFIRTCTDWKRYHRFEKPLFALCAEQFVTKRMNPTTSCTAGEN
ncbi:hypothetical protein TNIN_273811 [Trichonephila inaurata madagascariensis]|uniref:Uncharacterized protein n=1 Tax=Trichonephila inaurata madagascariensis TaxID=2747483 RepID=A0A8X7CLH4_9ARAC|nr:hypothetical protein TNIN_273811 [Trichonephila inaurata madagascariensis]